MLETSSSKAAEAMIPFASPMLASIERLVSRLARRIAGPQNQFTGRSLQFADRIFSRRLDNLGMGGGVAETGLAEREMEPQNWLLPRTWVPSAIALRGGPRSASAVEADPLTGNGAASTPLVLPRAARPPEAVAKTPLPVSTPAAVPAAKPLPTASEGTTLSAATGRAGLEPLMPFVAPALEAVRPAGSPAEESQTKPGAPIASQGAGRSAAETPVAQAARLASEALPASPSTSAVPMLGLATPGAPEVAAAGPAAPVSPATERAEQTVSATATSLPLSAVASPAATPLRHLEPSAGAASLATPTIPSPTGAAPGQVDATASLAPAMELVAAEPRLASAIGLSASAAAVPSLAAPPVATSAGQPSLATPAAGLPAAPVTTAASDQTVGVRATPAAVSPSRSPNVAPGEARVRDLLPPLLQRTAAVAAPALGRVSAFARSLGHLGWSDDRLGRTTAERGKAQSLNFEAEGEPASSPRAAAAPGLPMVRAADLTPRSATRPVAPPRQPVMAAAEPTPLRPVAPLRQPVVAATEPTALSPVTPRSLPMVALPPAGELGLPLPGPAAVSAAVPAAVVAPAASLESPLAGAPVSQPTPTAATPIVVEPVAWPPVGLASQLTAATAGSSAPLPISQAVAAPSAPLAPASASGLSQRELAATPPSAAVVSAPRTSGAAPSVRPTLLPGASAAPAGTGAGTAPLSPSLLASPALQLPRAARGPASLVELFLSGQSARAPLPGALPSLAATQPYRTPGALASHTERMANAIGTHVAAGSAGVDNPFGGGQRWSIAPGLTRGIARALGRAEAALPGRWAQRTLGSELPYLEEPGGESPESPTGVAAAALPRTGLAQVPPLLTRTASAPGVSPIGSVGASLNLARQPELALVPQLASLLGQPGLTPATALGAPAAEPGSAARLARPWQLAGGMATLAELFAAGVGLGTGAAGDIARQAGVAPAVGLIPPWLTKTAARSTFGLAASALAGDRIGRSRGPALEYVSDDSDESQEPASPTADPLARALSRADATPSGAALGAPQLAVAPLFAGTASFAVPAAFAAAAPFAAQSPLVTAYPMATAPDAREQTAAATRLPFWQHAGGLAATAEAFARGHGIGRVGHGASGTPAAAGRWVPVTGGMVFIGDESSEFEASATPAASAPAALASRVAAELGDRANPSAGSSALTGLSPLRPTATATAAEPEAVAAGPLALGRGVDWGRAGGLGLRTELFAAGLGSANLGAHPLSAARDLSSWSTAPGVASPLSRALRQSQPAAPARWTFGDSGLLFVSQPELGGAESSVARTESSVGATRSAIPLAVPGGEARPFVPSALAQSLGTQTMAKAGGERAAWMGPSALAERPWQRAGGTAILAELFAAGVGLGSGAASDLAQQAGVSAGRGPLPSWLTRLMSTEALEPSSAAQRLSGGGALPFVRREERRPEAARIPGGQPVRARPLSLALPVPGAAATFGATAQPLQAGATSAATDRRPLPVTATASSSLWQRAGGLAASAEAFARGRGMERTAEDSVDLDDSAEAAAGRWLPVSGGMVFVPRERPVAAAGKRAAAATRAAAGLPALATTERPLAAARPVDWQRAGGLGLRSELFASGLGQAPAGGTAAGSDPLGGWAAAHRMLASFPQQPSADEAPASRFAWNGPGGLLYLAGASPAQRGQRKAVPTTRRTADAAALPAGSVAALAERFSSGLGSEAGRVGERAVSPSALPLASLFGGREAERSGAGAASGTFLPGQLASAMLTGSSRPAAGGLDSPTALGPRMAMHSVDRLTKLLAQLPAQWLPSATVASALQAGGGADSPLWQRLPANLTRLAAAALRGDQPSTGEDGSDDAPAERHPHLTMVKGGPSGAAQKAAKPAEAAWKQQTPHAMVSAALQKVAGSGTPMAAAAKMLESIRGSASGQSPRSDDRISLGDLTLIAISMGENKMAAASQGHSPSAVPQVESAMRQDEVPNEPENEHTLSKKVDNLAKMVLKYVEKNEKMGTERGSFDA